MADEIIVHLVHGTWANGWLKPKSAWFENTSKLACCLRDGLPTNVKINSFYWSGRNCVAAREEAAARLAHQIIQNAANGEKIEHFIVAHSHGGTLAYEALKKLPENCRVKGLICMGTPFVSITPISKEKYWPGVAVIASLIDSLLWTLVLSCFPSVVMNSYGMMILFPIVMLVSIKLLILIAPHGEEAAASKTSIKVPIYLLRATRDEASLSLGLMQTFNWISFAFARRSEIVTINWRLPDTLIGYGIMYVSSLVGGSIVATMVAKLFSVALDDNGKLTLALIYSFGFAGLVYLLGYMSLALSVGHLRVRRWLNTMIEVDAAPPGILCKIKVYNVLGEFEGLRHGLYMSDNVVADLVNILDELIYASRRETP